MDSSQTPINGKTTGSVSDQKNWVKLLFLIIALWLLHYYWKYAYILFMVKNGCSMHVNTDWFRDDDHMIHMKMFVNMYGECSEGSTVSDLRRPAAMFPAFEESTVCAQQKSGPEWRECGFTSLHLALFY